MRKRTSLLVGAIVALFATVAIADWIEFENENRIEGEITKEEDGLVTIKVEGGTVTVPRSSIVRTTATDPREGDDREMISHRGGAATKLGDYRYLDGWNATTSKVEVRTFTLLRPVGELAHGTLVRVEETRRVNGTEMARVKVGEVEGWVPVGNLRNAGR